MGWWCQLSRLNVSIYKKGDSRQMFHKHPQDLGVPRTVSELLSGYMRAANNSFYLKNSEELEWPCSIIYFFSASVWVKWPHTCSQPLSILHSEMRCILHERQYTRLSSCSVAKSCPPLCGVPMTDCLITLMEYVYSDFDEMEARPLKAQVELSFLFCT